MPQVPEYGLLQVAPEVVTGHLTMADPTAQMPTDPTTIKAWGALGVQAGELGAQISEEERKLRDAADRTRAQEWMNARSVEIEDALYNKDTGMLQRKGQQVVKPESGEAFSVEGERRVGEILSKDYDTLNKRQQKLVQEYIGRANLQARSALIRHEAKEFDAHTVDVHTTAVTNAGNSLAQYGHDPVRRAADISQIRTSVAEIGRVKGWSDETIKLKGDEAVSKSLTGVVQTLMQDGNLGGAWSLFRAEVKNGNIMGADAVRLRKGLVKARQAAVARAAGVKVGGDILQGLSLPNQFASQCMKRGLISPELQKELSGAKTEDERNQILRRAANSALQKAGGDYVRAAAIFGGDDPAQVRRRGEEDGDETSESIDSTAHNAVADAMSLLPQEQMTPQAVYNEIRRRNPQLTAAQAAAMTPHAWKRVVAQQAAEHFEAQRQYTVAASAIDNGGNLADQDVSSLTPAQYQGLVTRQIQRDTGTGHIDNVPKFAVLSTDYRWLYSTKDDPASFEARIADLSVTQQQQMRHIRDVVIASKGKPAEVSTSAAEAGLKAYLSVVQPELLDKDHTVQYAFAKDAFMRQIEVLQRSTGNVGRALTPEQIQEAARVTVARPLIPEDDRVRSLAAGGFEIKDRRTNEVLDRYGKLVKGESVSTDFTRRAWLLDGRYVRDRDVDINTARLVINDSAWWSENYPKLRGRVRGHGEYLIAAYLDERLKGGYIAVNRRATAKAAESLSNVGSTGDSLSSEISGVAPESKNLIFGANKDWIDDGSQRASDQNADQAGAPNTIGTP